MRIHQIGDLNKAMLAAVDGLKVSTDALLRRLGIVIITVIEDHELNITEHVLNWVVIRTAFGQGNPMQLQLSHEATRRARLARMR